jgi:hypothetical protein
MCALASPQPFREEIWAFGLFQQKLDFIKFFRFKALMTAVSTLNHPTQMRELFKMPENVFISQGCSVDFLVSCWIPASLAYAFEGQCCPLISLSSTPQQSLFRAPQANRNEKQHFA